MFIGHFAVGFAAKRAAPRASLGVLVAAPILLDLLWPIFLLLGWERVAIDPGDTAFTPLEFVSYPISHSLLAAVGWGALLAAGYWAFGRDRPGALVVALLVVSHWVLDWLTHRPDLPLVPGLPLRVGLGLWNWPAATVIVESGMFVAGVHLYATATRARDGAGRWAFWALVAFLVLVYVGNMLGPPPPDVRALAFTALAMWLFVPWGHFIERHRELL